MAEPTTHYSMRAAAKRTGLSADVLRAWERRYAFVSPRRDSAGRRRYSEDEVERLELARAATALGHTIGRLAALPNVALRALVSDSRDEEGPAVETGELSRRVIAAIRGYDHARAEQLLATAATLLDPERFATRVVGPLMRQIGDLWERTRFSIAQEHMLSSIVRNLLGSIARLHPPSDGAPMVFATPPGETHEFGIVLAASLASLRRRRACLLGTNVPAREVARAARCLRARIVVIGALVSPHRLASAVYLTGLRAQLPAQTQLWVGGSLSAGANAREGIESVATLELFARRLDREA